MLAEVPTEQFRALADPTRRAVFERLSQREQTVTELKSNFAVSQPAISQHLAALRRAGLVSERRAGRHAYYCARPEGLKPLVTWLEQYQSFWIERIDQMKTVLESLEP